MARSSDRDVDGAGSGEPEAGSGEPGTPSPAVVMADADEV